MTRSIIPGRPRTPATNAEKRFKEIVKPSGAPIRFIIIIAIPPKIPFITSRSSILRGNSIALPKANTINTPITQANTIRPLSMLIPPFTRTKSTIQIIQVKENGYPGFYK